jgi:hypothetical protein
MPLSEKKKKLLKAKIAVALHDELESVQNLSQENSKKVI